MTPETGLDRPLPSEVMTGPRGPAAVRRRLDRMEFLLEGLARVPGTNRRLGLDVILDLLPVGGSFVAAAMGMWIAWEARNLGVSRWIAMKMVGNVVIDMLLGAIPFVGIIPDFFFKSNTRNMNLVRDWLNRHHPQALEGQASEVPRLR